MESLGGLITGHFAEYQIGRQALDVPAATPPELK